MRVAALEVERTQPTVEDAVELFMAKMMAGKNSAPGVLYRFTRLTEIIGTKKIRDLTRQDSIAALDTIGEGRRDGRTAKQFAGEVLTLAKRLWRFAKAREWVPVSCVEELSPRDFDARPKKREVTLRFYELAAIGRMLNNPLQADARNRSFYMGGRIAASKTQTPRLDRERSLEVSCRFLHVSVVYYFVMSAFVSPAINARFFSVSVWSNFSTPPSRTWLLKVLR